MVHFYVMYVNKNVPFQDSLLTLMSLAPKYEDINRETGRKPLLREKTDEVLGIGQ